MNDVRTRYAMTSSLRLAVLALLFLGLPETARAQWSRNVLLVSNARSAVSREIADYYQQKRSIAGEQVVRVDVPVADEIPRADYEARIEKPIADWLTSHAAQDRILYIVLTKDVPLRVSGTGGPTGSVASVDSELALLYRKFMGQTIRLAGSLENPYFLGDRAVSTALPFTRKAHDIYLVTRLDGYTVGDVKALIDRGVAPARQGTILLDGRSELVQSVGNNWLIKASAAVTKMPGWSDRVVLDTSAKVLRGATDVLGYYSWGSNDAAIKDRHLEHVFVRGAIGGQFVSTDGRTFVEPPATWKTNANPFRGSHQSLVGDLIRDGITGVAGHVAEPYLNATIRPDVLFPAYLAGFNLAESFYMAMPYLSWQTVVIGDPLCAPFRQRPLDQTDLDAPVDPATELPGFLSRRRVAALVASGATKEAAELVAKAEVRLSRRDPAGARAALEQATSLAPSFVSAQLTLAQMYEASGNWDGAIARYRRVIEAKPDDATALNNLAYALATRKNDPASALPFAKRAYTAKDSTGAAADTLAWVQHLLGNDAEALPLIAAAAKQLPEVAEIRLHAAVILAATGNLAASKDELDRALKLDESLGDHDDVEQLRQTLGVVQ
jgi:uncharacterized protein (TIGR03790 family)